MQASTRQNGDLRKIRRALAQHTTEISRNNFSATRKRRPCFTTLWSPFATSYLTSLVLSLILSLFTDIKSPTESVVPSSRKSSGLSSGPEHRASRPIVLCENYKVAIFNAHIIKKATHALKRIARS